jgi:hypothetical protein
MLGTASVPSLDRLHEQYANPQQEKLLNLLQMKVRCERCREAQLFTPDGRRILDRLSGNGNDFLVSEVVHLAHYSAGFLVRGARSRTTHN